MTSRFILIAFLGLSSASLCGQVPWVVPADRNVKLSQTEFADQNRNSGKDLYMTNCKSCHGEPGKNNAIKLVPQPPDPATSQLQQNSDGALQFKISEGRGPMPSFKNVLSSADIWNIIAFIRSFNIDYKQQIAVKPTYGGEVLDKVSIQLSQDQGKTVVVAMVTGEKGGLKKPLPGLEVKLFVKCYFGNLMVDKAGDTDAEGKVTFNFPKNLPGDPSGKLVLLAQLSNEELFGLVKTESVVSIGVPINRPPLNEPRALWNVVQKTPLWLLFTYVICVLAVWGLIFVVLFKLKTIFELGKSVRMDD
jgi:cytochrome c553